MIFFCISWWMSGYDTVVDLWGECCRSITWPLYADVLTVAHHWSRPAGGRKPAICQEGSGCVFPSGGADGLSCSHAGEARAVGLVINISNKLRVAAWCSHFLSLVNGRRSEVNTESYIWSQSTVTFTCTTWSQVFVSTWIGSARRPSLSPLHMKPPQESSGSTRRVRWGTRG